MLELANYGPTAVFSSSMNVSWRMLLRHPHVDVCHFPLTAFRNQAVVISRNVDLFVGNIAITMSEFEVVSSWSE